MRIQLLQADTPSGTCLPSTVQVLTMNFATCWKHLEIRFCSRGAFLRQLITVKHNNRPLSSSKERAITTEEKIVLTDDGSTVVCWHPETEFPYEFSRPLPEETPKNEGVLKVQSLPQVRAVFKQKAPEYVREELQNLTFTTKHRWFPRSRDKRAKKTPPDREYL